MKLTFIRNVGQGGFGIVDEVIDDSGQVYARKTFQINQGAAFPKNLEENVAKRFVREAKVQSAINHKNIVPVVGMELNISPPFFLMPLALNSLQTDIESDRTLDGKL